MIDSALYNRQITGWGHVTRNELINSIEKLSQKGKGDLVKKLSMKTRKDYGLIDRITYSFPRHGVFFHKGTGRGYKVVAGQVVRAPSGKSKILNAEGIKRKPAEWFNPVIDNNIDNLADLVANYMADAAVNATRIKIN
jgi:hypothetical protein